MAGLQTFPSFIFSLVTFPYTAADEANINLVFFFWKPKLIKFEENLLSELKNKLLNSEESQYSELTDKISLQKRRINDLEFTSHNYNNVNIG